ncbi:hypothetical protein Taro_013616 [Colocasia esculenta]|uniref:Uncharacterized protein n=1 Tax=Colocasia esculenta TaxID=4460 RepID=A0A843UGI2_COLES|nr:hypothetical protein [Colocasia esculenta]
MVLDLRQAWPIDSPTPTPLPSSQGHTRTKLKVSLESQQVRTTLTRSGQPSHYGFSVFEVLPPFGVASGLTRGVIVELGARRRWPFRREGPNGSALLLEVGTLNSSRPSMLPSPLRLWFLVVWGCGSMRIMLVFGVVSGRIILKPLSTEKATTIEVAMMPRSAWLPRHHHDALGCRDIIATAWAAATMSRQVWAPRQGRDGPMRRDYSRDIASSPVWSYTSRSPGARYLRACPVREVVTIAWDPRPRAPIEGVLRAAGVLESRTLERRGKR